MKLSVEQVLEKIGTLSAGELRLWIQEGWIAPAGGEAAPLFDEADVARIQLVCQLRDDLALNEDAVSVVLSLIDQIHGLRRELRILAQIIENEPDAVRQRIRTAHRAKLKQ